MGFLEGGAAVITVQQTASGLAIATAQGSLGMSRCET